MIHLGSMKYCMYSVIGFIFLWSFSYNNYDRNRSNTISYWLPFLNIFSAITTMIGTDFNSNFSLCIMGKHHTSAVWIEAHTVWYGVFSTPKQTGVSTPKQTGVSTPKASIGPEHRGYPPTLRCYKTTWESTSTLTLKSEFQSLILSHLECLHLLRCAGSCLFWLIFS